MLRSLQILVTLHAGKVMGGLLVLYPYSYNLMGIQRQGTKHYFV
jgi:hypothetical protein